MALTNKLIDRACMAGCIAVYTSVQLAKIAAVLTIRALDR